MDAFRVIVARVLKIAYLHNFKIFSHFVICHTLSYQVMNKHAGSVAMEQSQIMTTTPAVTCTYTSIRNGLIAILNLARF